MDKSAFKDIENIKKSLQALTSRSDAMIKEIKKNLPKESRDMFNDSFNQIKKLQRSGDGSALIKLASKLASKSVKESVKKEFTPVVKRKKKIRIKSKRLK